MGAGNYLTLKQLASFLVVLIWSQGAFAQNTGSVKGVVTENGSPVEFANVFLRANGDTTTIVSGTVTDSLGTFRLENLALNQYVLTVQIVGFIKKEIPVSCTQINSTIDLHEIRIEADVLQLNTVEVKAMRNIIKKTEDGFVMNAKDNLTQIGGTAADLLRNMPGILVDADGGITIRGKSPLTLINGRISGIAGTDRTAQLDRIPASSIERIEIINNPSAKFDADSEGGIINLVLRKNQDLGTNGAFAVGAGRGDRYRFNGSMLFNYKTRKWNFGAAYDNWYTTRTRKVTGDRTNFNIPDDHFLIQRRSDERLILYQNAKATIDFAPNKNNSLGFEALWAFPGENNNETLKNTYEDSVHGFRSRNQRHSNEIRRTQAVELSLNYTKRFSDPNRLLSANISNTFNYDKENTDIDTQILTEQDEIKGSPSLQRTHTYQTTNLANASVDYAQPAGKNAMFETGYKGIMRVLNADFERANFAGGQFITDPLNSNVFDFKEQIHACYAQFTGWTGEKTEPKWKYNAGLRAEEVWNSGKTINESDKFNNNYFNLFPSANFYYYTPKGNNFKLSYNRRINRPGLGQLNPFIDITDSLNQHAGNTRLKPELIHALEFGYSYSASKASLSLAAFYRIRNHAIFSYIAIDDNGVALSQPRNFGHAETYGMEAIASYSPVSFWSLNFSFSVFETRIEDNEAITDISNNQLSWYTKLINTIAIARNSKLQVVGNYTSPTAVPQGRSIAIYNVDAGFQQTLMKGKGRLGLVITDVFNTQKSGLITSDYNFTASRSVKLDTRAIMITFGYTFGTSFKEKLMENKFQND